MKHCRRCEQDLPLSSFRIGKTAPRVCEPCLSKLIAGAVFTMNATEATSFLARLEAGETLRTIVGGGGNTICSKKAFNKHCELYPEWGAKALGLAERNRKLADKRKGRPDPNLPVRPTNAIEEDIPTFPELKARNFSIPDCAAAEICINCPHPADCATLGECLDKINARAAIPRQEEYMRPAQVAACMSALEGGMSKRWLTGYVKGTKAIVSGNKFEKHCVGYPIWGAWALALIERNRKLADKKKGHRGVREFCHQGHPYVIHGKSYLQKDGRWHRQCLACVSSRHTNPTHTPKPELFVSVKAAIDAGQRVGSFTQKLRKPETFICDFRQLRAIRRLHPELEQKLVANSARPIIIRPAKRRITRTRSFSVNVRSNLRTPTLTGIIAGQPHEIFTAVDRALPRYLDVEARQEAMGDMILAILEQRLTIDDAPRRYREFLKATNRMFPTKYAPPSLDAPAFRGGEIPYIDRVSVGLWS
jgi:hypothetical protein